jgi:hypothetical protein
MWFALTLGAGRHEIATAVGLDSGIDIDRLVLRSATYDAPAARPHDHAGADGDRSIRITPRA